MRVGSSMGPGLDEVALITSDFVHAESPTRAALALITWFCTAYAFGQSAGTPRFEDYPVNEHFTGTPTAPILVTPDQRMFRTRIRNGISSTRDVWIGSYKNPVRAKGPNFAGHYFAIRWGCGSQCLMMAIVDAETGTVYSPPLARKDSLWVPLDNLGDRETDLRPDSSLMILRNACRDFKNLKTCGTYYFNWKDNQFVLIKFVFVDALKDLAP